MKFKKEHIPNYISAFRLVLVPLYILLFCGIVPGWNRLASSAVVFIIAGVSDLVDGFLARKNQWISDLGKLLDPFADKMMELAVTICLAIWYKGAFIFLAVITVIKEVIMIGGALIILRRGKITVFSAWYGKATTLAWFTTVCLVSFAPSALENPLWCHVLCTVLIAFMAFAFVMYVVRFRDAIIKTKNELFHGKNEEAPLTEAEESK